MGGGSGTVQPDPDFELRRITIRPEGCFGVLLQDSLIFATTLERTYTLAGGVQMVKIPNGLWICKSTYYHKGGYDTYEIMDVPGHSRLLLHKGAIEMNSEGCVLVGRGFSWFGGTPGISESGYGFMEFMRRTRGQPSFRLLISQWRDREPTAP